MSSTATIRVLAIGAVLLVGAAATYLVREAGHDHADESGASVYVCPMHPWIKSEEPGKCTICGMSLVSRSVATLGDALPAGTIALSESQITTIGVATSPVARQPLVRTLRVSGRVMHDLSRQKLLTARVPGWIEELNVTVSGEYVSAGQPLATIYSPEMLTAQRVYLERLRAELAFSPADIAAAREHLLRLGLTNDDIATLEQTLAPSAIVTVRAPVEGTVIEQYAIEGQYLEAGDRIAAVSDLTQMWFLFDAYETDTPLLQVGQQVDITTDTIPGEVISEPIAFIDPNFDEMTRSTKVRVILTNTHFFGGDDVHLYLPHRVQATGLVHLPSPEVLALPRTAVLDSGTGPVAYVALGGGGYERRPLVLGRRGDDLVEVIQGVSEGEQVATRAALLLDAQAQYANP